MLIKVKNVKNDLLRNLSNAIYETFTSRCIFSWTFWLSYLQITLVFFVNRYQICIIPVSSWTLFNVQLDMRSCNWLVAIAIYYKRNISAEHFYSALSFPSINTMNFKLVLYFSLISKISTHPLRRKRHTPDSSLPFGIWSQSISLSEDTFCPSSSVELTSTEWDM